MKNVGFGACLAGFILVIFAGVLMAMQAVGTDDELYYELQMEAGVLEYAGISGEDLARLDEALADCLRGNPGALDVNAEVFGENRPAFNEKERIHMEDCRQLFILLRRVLAVAAVLGVSALIAGVRLLRDRRRIRLAAWIAPLVLALPLGVFAISAAFDFNSAFNFFHEMLFTNDLWLLDPRTDLLIHICPSSMFMKMGARIGLIGLAWMLFVPILATAATILTKERV